MVALFAEQQPLPSGKSGGSRYQQCTKRRGRGGRLVFLCLLLSVAFDLAASGSVSESLCVSLFLAKPLP